MSKAPPKGVFERSTKLLSLAAGLAQKELTGRLSQAVRGVRDAKIKVDQARDLVKQLGELKGAAMKAGQFLTYELRDYLPPQVVEILSELQNRAVHVHFTEIQNILKEELTLEKFNLLEEIEPSPIAAASIGQVHRASYQNQRLALKVQYRGVAQAIDSDLVILERITKTFLTLSFKKINLEGLFDEVKTILKQETDYLLEAQNLERYAAYAAPLLKVKIPKVYKEFTTKKVLALSFEEGLTFEEWIKTNPVDAIRNEVADQFLELYFHEFYVWGFVQTDPNFANFLFQPNQSNLILLDFGAMKEYPVEFRRIYIQFLMAVSESRFQTVIELAIQIGMIDPRETPETKQNFYALVRSIVGPFDKSYQPFDFANQTYIDQTRQKLLTLVKSLKYSPPPRQLIFLHRKLSGIYFLLRTLRVKRDLSVIWERLKSLKL